MPSLILTMLKQAVKSREINRNTIRKFRGKKSVEKEFEKADLSSLKVFKKVIKSLVEKFDNFS